MSNLWPGSLFFLIPLSLSLLSFHIRFSSSFPLRLPIDNFDLRLEVTGPKLICARNQVDGNSLSLSFSLSLFFFFSFYLEGNANTSLNYTSIELGLGHVRLVRMPAGRTYSPTCDYSAFMDSSARCYYPMPTDLDIDDKSS